MSCKYTCIPTLPSSNITVQQAPTELNTKQKKKKMMMMMMMMVCRTRRNRMFINVDITLIVTILLDNSADDKLMIFFLVFPQQTGSGISCNSSLLADDILVIFFLLFLEIGFDISCN